MRGASIAAVVAVLATLLPTALSPPAVAAPPAGPSFRFDDLRHLDDVAIGNGVCATSAGTCTLRAAIQEANANSADQNLITPAPDVDAVTAGVQATGTILLDSPSTPMLVATISSEGDLGAWFNVTGPAVIDLQGRVGLSSTFDTPLYAGFYLNGPDVTVRAFPQVRAAETAFVVGPNGARVLIEKGTLADTTTSILERLLWLKNGATDVTVRDVTVDDLLLYGVRVEDAATVTNLTLDRVSFRDSSPGSLDLYRGLYLPANATLNGLTITRSTFSDFFLEVLWLLGTVNNLSVVGNTFASNAAAWAIDLQKPGTNRVIRANSFTPTATAGATAIRLGVASTTSDLFGLQVLNNVFDGYLRDNTIEMYFVKQVTIRQNRFTNVLDRVEAPGGITGIVDLYIGGNFELRPLISSATVTGCTVTATVQRDYAIAGYVPAPPFAVDLYWSSKRVADLDGDAAVYLGSATAPTTAALTFTLPLTSRSTGSLRAQITDVNGNSSELSPRFAVTGVDTCPPTVTVEQGPAQDDPSTFRDVRFAATFSEPLAAGTLTATDVSTAGSTAGGVTVTSVTQVFPGVYTITARATSSGVIVLSLPAGAATDTAGNPTLASTSVDNGVTWVSPYSIAPISLTVTEGGAPATTVITASVAPARPVTVSFTGAATQVTVPAVTFGSETPSTTVTVTAVDDAVLEAPATITLRGVVSSADLEVEGIVLDPVVVTVLDNDDPTADLVLTKSHVGAATAGSSITYSLALTNLGPQVATGPIVLTDPMPPGLTAVNATGTGWSCTVAATVSCTRAASLPVGQAAPTVTLVANVAPTVTSTITNTATATSPTPDRSPPSASDPTAVQVVNDLALSKTKPAGTYGVSANSTVPYSLVTRNLGPSSVPAGTTLTVVDTFDPTRFALVSAGGSGWSCAGVTSPVSCSLTLASTLAVNASVATLPVTLRVVASGALANTGVLSLTSGAVPVTDPVTANNTSVDSLTAEPVADLVAAKALTATSASTPGTLVAGGTGTYTLTVTNDTVDPQGAAQGVSLTDQLPAGVTVTGLTVSPPGAVACPAVPLTGTFTCTRAAGLAAGAPLTVVADVAVASSVPAGVLTNRVTAATTTREDDLSDNTATAVATVSTSANLRLTKTATPSPAVAGSTLTYRLTVTNTGPSDARTVVLTDRLPSVLTVTTPAGCSAAGTNPRVLTCVLGTMVVGASTTVVVGTRVGDTLVASVTNAASVTTVDSDPDLADNSAAVTVPITGQAVLGLAKTGPATVTAGTAVAYTLTASNAGPSVARSPSLVDTLPAGVTFSSASGCTHSAGVVTCALTDLAAGASLTRTINVTVDASAVAGANLTNTARLTATAGADAVAVTAAATVASTVVRSADLRLAKADSPDPVSAGSTLTYTLTLTNDGPSDASNIVITDPMPPGLGAVVVSPACAPGATVTCLVPSLRDGQSTSVTIAVAVPADLTTSPVVNTASVSGSEPDPDGLDNTATSTTVVQASTVLTLSKTAPSVGTAGSTFAFTLAVTNRGPTAARNVVIADAIPAPLSVVDGGGCAGTSTLTCAIGVLGANQSATRVVVVSAPSTVVNTTSVTNRATATAVAGPADTPLSSADTTTTSIRRSADLQLTKTATPSPVVAGTTLTYVLTVTNVGPSEASSVVLRDSLPSNVSSVAAAGCTVATRTVTCQLGGLAVGASASRVVTAVVLSTTTTTSVTNAATVTANETDPNAPNSAAKVTVPIVGAATLTVAKTGPATVVAGTNIAYTVLVRNAGPSAARTVRLVDALPPGTAYVSATGGSCTQAVGVVTCTLGTILPGVTAATRTITVTTASTLPTGTVISNRAVATGLTGPQNLVLTASATATTVVERRADVQVTKTASPNPVTAGTSLTYTLTVRNNGPSEASSVVVVDALPAGVLPVDTGPCTVGPPVTCRFATLARSASTTVVVAAVVDPATTASTLVNTATVTATEPDSSLVNNTSTATSTVVGQTTLTVVKAAPVIATAGASITYTITVANAGPSAARAVVLTDALPSQLALVSAPGCGGGPPVTCALGNLGPGASTTVTVEATIASTTRAGTDLVNSASANGVTGPASAPVTASATATTRVDRVADLAIVKSASPLVVTAGGTTTFRLAVTNLGPSEATDAVVTDLLPVGLELAGAGGSCGSPVNGIVSCAIATIPTVGVGATVEVTFSARLSSSVVEGSTLVNTATVDAAELDPVAGNDQDDLELTATRTADLRVVKTGPPTVVAGREARYDVVVTNLGPSDASSVVVTDLVPPGARYLDASSTVACEEGPTGVVTCPVGSLPAGTSVAGTITLAIDPAALEGSVVTNTARVDATEPDPVPGNDEATWSSTVTRVADVGVLKEADQTIAVPGGPLTYTVTVRNAGPSVASRVTVTDTLPAGLTVTGLTTTQGTCTPGIRCDLGDLTVGATAVVTVDVDIDPSLTATSITNEALVTAAEPDDDPSDNSSRVDTNLDPNVDVRFTKVDDRDVVVAGTSFVYTIVARNRGLSTLTAGASLVDTMPVDLTVESVSATGGLCSNTTTSLACTLGSLAPSAAATVTVVVRSDPALDPVGGDNQRTNVATLSYTKGASTVVLEAPETTTFTTLAALVVTKTGPATAVAGATAAYTLAVRNDGPSVARGVTLVDDLAPGTSFESGDAACGPAGASTVRCAVGLLVPGSTASFVVVVRLASNLVDGSELANRASADGASAVATTTVRREVDLRATKAATPEPAVAGAPLDYSIVVTNDGPSDASGVVVTDLLPPGVAPTSLPALCSAAGLLLSCALGEIPAGQSVTLALGGSVAASLTTTPVVNVAAVTSVEPERTPLDNTSAATSTLVGAASLQLVKQAPATVTAGTTMAYTFTLSNNGPSQARGLSVVDTLPPGLSFVGGTGCSGTTTVTCDVGVLDPGRSEVLPFVVAVDPALAAGTVLTNAATVTGVAGPTTAVSASATATTTVDRQADLVIDKTAAASRVVAGTTTTFRVTVTNLGPSAASSVVVTDVLPPSLDLVGVRAPGLACSGLTTVTCTLATLAASASATVELEVSARAGTTDGATVTNTAEVVAAEPDPTVPNTASTVVTVDRRVDLELTKVGPATAVAGSTLAWTLRVVNLGPSRAEQVTLRDTLPPGVTVTNGGCSGFPVCVLPGLDPGQAATVTVTALLAPSLAAGSTLTNRADVDSPEVDTGPGNDRALADTRVERVADLRVLKTGPSTVAAGAPVSYTVEVTNLGPSDASSVTVVDTLPAGVTGVAGCAGDDAVQTCGPVGLAAGASTSFTITATVPPGLTASSITNTATVDGAEPDPVTANDTAAATTAVGVDATLGLTKAGPANATAGATFAWTLTLTKTGTTDARNATVVDELPVGSAFVSADPGCSAAGRTVTCTVGTLSGATSVTRSVVARADADLLDATPLTNTATASAVAGPGDEPRVATASAGVVVRRSSDLVVTKTAAASVVTAGTDVAYSVEVTNLGPSAASDVVLTDVLPASLVATGLPSPCVAAGDTVTCPLGGLTAGASTSLTLVAHLSPGATSASTHTNVVQVASASADPVAATNRASATVTAALSVDLVVEKTGPATVVAGGSATFTVTVANVGPSVASSVVVTDLLPPGTTPLPGPGCVVAPSRLTCDVGSILPGGVATVTVTATVASTLLPGDALVNEASATSAEPDANPADNLAQATTTVERLADLSVTKTAAPSPVVAGATLTYTLTVENLGPSEASEVRLRDTLPSALVLVDAGACSAGATLTCDLGTLDAGASTTVTVVTTVAPGTVAATIVNTATVAGAEPDPDAVSNTATSSTPVTAATTLTLDKQAPPAATAGGTMAYTLVVTNAGPSTARAVTVDDALPVELTVVSTTSPCVVTSTVTCALGDLGPGAVATVSIVVTVASSVADGAAVTNTATATARLGPASTVVTASDAATTAVVRSADLAVAKTGPATVTAGGRAFYQVTVTNLGPSAASSVAVVDTLAPDTTFVGAVATPGCTAGGSVVTCPGGDLAVGASRTVVVDVAVDPLTTASTLTDVGSAVAAEADPVASNDTAPFASAVGRLVDLSVTKQSDVNRPTAGATITYTIVGANAGPSVATGVTVTDELPAGLTVLSSSGPGGACTGAAPTLTCAVGTLAPAQRATVTITAQLAPDLRATSITNRAVVSGLEPDTVSSNDASEVVNGVDFDAQLNIVKTDTVDPVVAGQTFAYRIVASNAGPSTAFDAVVDDVMPNGLVALSASTETGSCAVTSGGTDVRCTLGDLAPGATVAATIVVQSASWLPDGAQRLNVANLRATVGLGALGRALFRQAPNTSIGDPETTTFVRQARLGTSKTGTPNPVAAGGRVTWTITVENLGPSDVSDVQVTDLLADDLTFVSATPGAPACTALGQLVTCGLAAVPASSSTVVTVVAEVASSVPAGSTIANEAESTATEPNPPGTTNATTAASVRVVRGADLSVTKTGPAGPVAPGSRLDYVVAVTNLGPSDASSVTVVDTLPTGTLFVSASSGCSAAGQVVTCLVGQLADGSVATVTITAQLAPGVANTSLRNSARADAAEPDQDPANSAAFVDTAVGPLPFEPEPPGPVGRPDLRLTKSTPSAVVPAGSIVTFVLQVTNQGSAAATAVTVTDTMPAGLVPQPPPAGCTLDAQTATCRVASLAVGATASFTLAAKVTARPPALLSNRAVVSSATTDPTLPDNVAVADLVVVRPAVVLPPTGAQPGSAVASAAALVLAGLGLLATRRRAPR